jgi:hypothetical protein
VTLGEPLARMWSDAIDDLSGYHDVTEEQLAWRAQAEAALDLVVTSFDVTDVGR